MTCHGQDGHRRHGCRRVGQVHHRRLPWRAGSAGRRPRPTTSTARPTSPRWRSGIAADRRGPLRPGCGGSASGSTSTGGHQVVTCSALRRSYRDIAADRRCPGPVPAPPRQPGHHQRPAGSADRPLHAPGPPDLPARPPSNRSNPTRTRSASTSTAPRTRSSSEPSRPSGSPRPRRRDDRTDHRPHRVVRRGHRRFAGRRPPARGGLLRRRRLVGAARGGGPRPRRRPGGRHPRGLAEPGRGRAGRRPTRWPRSSAPRWSRSHTHEGDNAAYRANGPDRCFHCKDELFTRISDDVVAAHGLDAVAYGENADDAVRPDRPGARAATNHRVLRPLADAGLTKADVRELARAWSLPCADKPAAPCLASRIPHHEEVTPEKLGQIDQAEAALRALGFADLRVRHHGDIARLELPLPDLVRAATDPVREQVRRAVLTAGFRYVDSRSGRHAVRRLHPDRAAGRPWSSAPLRTRSPRTPTSTSAGPRGAATRRRSTARARPSSRSPASPPPLGQHREVTVTVHPGQPGARQGGPAGAAGRRVRRRGPAAGLAAAPPEPTGGLVVVAAAGTSDLPVAREALLTARYLGRATELVVDVGVAGLHRILARLDLLRQARALVVAAGMDGALPSVVAGLVCGPGDRPADLGRLRRLLRRHRRPADHAQLLLAGGQRGQHRQRLRRRPPGRADRRPA